MRAYARAEAQRREAGERARRAMVVRASMAHSERHKEWARAACGNARPRRPGTAAGAPRTAALRWRGGPPADCVLAHLTRFLFGVRCPVGAPGCALRVSHDHVPRELLGECVHPSTPRPRRALAPVMTPLGVSTLPAELKRNFILLRDLDDRTQGTLRRFACAYSHRAGVLNKVDRIASQYRGSGKKTLEEFLTPDELTAVKAELADAVRIGEEKIQIANHSYEVVDKHIRRLDQDLKKFEEELERERVHQEQMQEQALIAMGKPKKRKRCAAHDAVCSSCLTWLRRDDTDAGASKSSRTSRNRNASRSCTSLRVHVPSAWH